MAHDLNLNTTQTANSVRVSWNDVQANDMKKGAGAIVGFTVIGAWAGLGLMTIVMSSGWPLLLALVICVGVIYWYQNGSYTVPNAVDFSPDTITHQGRNFPTNRVTRFEYGQKSVLTGVQPARAKNGETATDPSIVRLWIDDAQAYTISENNWQIQGSHQIRDALARALDEVRKGKAKEARAEKFGDQGDLGMPDY